MRRRRGEHRQTYSILVVRVRGVKASYDPKSDPEYKLALTYVHDAADQEPDQWLFRASVASDASKCRGLGMDVVFSNIRVSR